MGRGEEQSLDGSLVGVDPWEVGGGSDHPPTMALREAMPLALRAPKERSDLKRLPAEKSGKDCELPPSGGPITPQLK